MKQTPYQFTFFVQISQGPAAHARDGTNTLTSSGKGACIFPEHPFYDILVLDVFVVSWANRRATGEAAFIAVRKTKSNLRTGFRD